MDDPPSNNNSNNSNDDIEINDHFDILNILNTFTIDLWFMIIVIYKLMMISILINGDCSWWFNGVFFLTWQWTMVWVSWIMNIMDNINQYSLSTNNNNSYNNDNDDNSNHQSYNCS